MESAATPPTPPTLSTCSGAVYSLSNIYSIINAGFNFSVPVEILDNITSVANKVGAPNYIKTPIFDRAKSRPDGCDKKHKKRHGQKYQQVTTAEWDMIIGASTHQSTNRDTDPTTTCVNNIRMNLNKLTNKNQPDIMRKIDIEIANLKYHFSAKEMSDLQPDAAMSEEDISKCKASVATMIYDILTSNKFYSDVYSRTYIELSEKCEWLTVELRARVNKYLSSFDNIQSADPDVDYDKFCAVNKANELKQAESHFILNLARNKTVEPEIVVSLIQSMLKKIFEYIALDGKITEVDVLTNNMCILIDAGMIQSVEEDASDEEDLYINGCNIMESVRMLAESKPSKSLSSKTKFKYMDILDM